MGNLFYSREKCGNRNIRYNCQLFTFHTNLLIVILLLPNNTGFSWSNNGALLAICSGAITSGMGYALWYYVLPKIPSTNAAVSQLSVPLIAAAGGMVFMQELITLKFILSCVLVLGGIAITIGIPKSGRQ